MNETALKYATYWRNSLADAELGKGAWKKQDLSNEFIALPKEILGEGAIDHITVAKLFNGEPKSVDSIDLVVMPKAYALRLEHGVKFNGGLPEIVTPLVCVVRVNRAGFLIPAGKTVIARDILDPLDRGNFAIGEVAVLDEYLTRHEFVRRKDGDMDAVWEDYLKYCSALMTAVVGEWPGIADRYELTGSWYLKKIGSLNSPSQYVIAVYDDMRKCDPEVPLFSNYAAKRRSPDEECLPKNATFQQRYAHSGDKYPLAEAQRDALSHLVISQDGEIVAVNGPPGTGKTTMLLSVVATLWTKAALEKGDPPVICAASTNNQAVTNIIDAFGKDFASGTGDLAGRWLPDIGSFGAYFPARSKEADAAAKYQTPAFFNKVESSAYVAKATEAYVEAGKRVFPDLSSSAVVDIVEALHGELCRNADALAKIAYAWGELIRLREIVKDELGEDPSGEMLNRESDAMRTAASKEALLKALTLWEDHLAQEPFWLTLFSWVPAIARRRLAIARAVLDRAGVLLRNERSLSELEVAMNRQTAQSTDAFAVATKRLETGKRVLGELQNAEDQWQTAAFVLGSDHQVKTLADADTIADITIRFRMFLLATHYWEGRWLLAMTEFGDQIEDEKKRKGRKVIEARWRRRMMLTPCIVSTFFMLPTQMKCTRRESEGYIEDYLYNFIDLLVVDEAGQVLPEVAGASFALAKRALVIGDTLQIEPIWQIPGHVDIGNLIAAGLLQPDASNQDFEAISDLGKTASMGSVMQIAQNASRYHYVPELSRGLYLFEHRRCLEEIIQFCNQLCYHGKLIPCRELNISTINLPAMGYLHVDGVCTQGGLGSRQNKVEAETIASWIADHRDMLESVYGEPLHKIIGIVTPFAGQSELVSRECRKKGLKTGPRDGEMTIGTVHALQGAERRVIIFSPTYSKHSDGSFVDQRASMLNVAVSRAKDSFLVFGDMDTFNPLMRSRPRGLLATFLFSNPGNALSYPPIKRSDITGMGAGFKVLHNSEEHDAFMLEALAYAKEEVMIVTPWFKMGKLKSTGALGAMTNARARGVRVTIYTAKEFNTNTKALLEAGIELKASGIKLLVVNKVHSKIVACDADLLCIGSFNWFGAARDGEYKRYETSLVYQGAAVSDEILVNRNSLQLRLIA